MAYRFNGTDPKLYTSPGGITGWARNSAFSWAALLKRISASAWHGITAIEDTPGSNFSIPGEFNPSNQLANDISGGAPFSSTATFNDTTNWMIVGGTWDGTASGYVHRWKIGTGAYSSETETGAGGNASTVSSTYHLLVGNEAGLADDANYDMCCIGMIKSNLSSTTWNTLDMTAFTSWQGVFTGSTAWLLGFETISTQTDRTGNGGNETSRSAGITLQSDPPGWSWGAAAAYVRPTIVVPNSAMMRSVL